MGDSLFGWRTLGICLALVISLEAGRCTGWPQVLHPGWLILHRWWQLPLKGPGERDTISFLQVIEDCQPCARTAAY